MAIANSNAQGYNGGRFYSGAFRPVIADCSFTVAPADVRGLGITNLEGSLIHDVFMYTSATPGVGNSGITNPLSTISVSQGYALIKLKNNYKKVLGMFDIIQAPNTGASLAINAASLIVGSPYVINSVGHGSLGAATIATVADVAGSLASSWFRLYDQYGKTYIVWFYVTGIGGTAPSGVSGTLIQQTIPQNETANNIATALGSTLALLPSGISGVNSFTTGVVGNVVTVTSTQTNPYGPLPGAPANGTISPGFTMANSVIRDNTYAWQAVGLPKGLIPAVGQSFIATAAGFNTGGSSTGTVQALGASNNYRLELLGNPSASISLMPQGGSPNVGGFIMVQFLTPTAGVMLPTAPTVGTVVKLNFYIDYSSVSIAGS